MADNIRGRYDECQAERKKYMSLWEDISRFVGIRADIDNFDSNNTSNKNDQLDTYVDDPTSAISVIQAGDSLLGIMWGTGDNALSIVPSRYVLENANEDEVSDFYDFATDQLLYHMNHADAGLNNSLKPYVYDQSAFGNSAIGAFRNEDFVNRTADNLFIFRNYGVDSTCIDEGKSGNVDYTFTKYHWRVARIVGEFATENGAINKGRLAKLPKEIQEAWNSGKLNKEFDIVFAVYPREDFNPALKGKRGAKYKGVWFLESSKDGSFFHEEDFNDRPIVWARMILVRGEVYGRSSGTMLLSSIRSVNFMVGTAIEVIEKMANPSLGILNNALFGDSALDTSPNGLTVFNSTLAAGQTPTFPLFDVGDPNALVQFLVPYLNEKVATAFKVDVLLDFNSSTAQTATESLQRGVIRGQSLSGLLMQQKSELLEPLVKRCVSLALNAGELGVDPRIDEQAARRLKDLGKPERIIPQSVLDVIESGRPWYEIQFNNELEKLTRTEAVQNLLQVLNSIGAIASMYPKIIEAVDWYALLKDINKNLDANNQILLSEREFKAKIEAAIQQQQAAAMLQAGQAAAQIDKDSAQADKSRGEVQNAK